MSPLLLIAIIIFLLIFVAAAALTLLSLIGKVKMPKNYQKQLFAVLLLEVIGVVIAFVSYNLKPDMAPDISEKILLHNSGSWDWSNPESRWRSNMIFSKNSDGKLVLNGTTYYSPGQYQNPIEIYKWKSINAIEIPTLGKEIQIDVEKTTLENIVIPEPERIKEIGMKEKGKIILSTSLSLVGDYIPDSSQHRWGVVLNYKAGLNK